MMTTAKHSPTILLFAFLLLGLILSTLAHGQVGVIKGVVCDRAGNPLKNVKITLLDLKSGNRYSIKSGEEGKFFKVGIPAAAYRMTVELDGYKTCEQPLMVAFGKEEVLSITLEKIPPKIDEDKDFLEGVTFCKQAQYAQAVQSFEKVTARFPDSPEAFYNLGVSFLRNKETEKSILSLEKAVGLKPDMVEGYFALGEAYFNKEKKDKAMEAFSRTTQLQPANPKAYYNLGIIYYKYNMLDEARGSFKKVMDLDPGFSSAYYQAGLVCIGKRELQAAIDYFVQFLKIEPDAPEADRVKTMIEELKKQIRKDKTE